MSGYIQLKIRHPDYGNGKSKYDFDIQYKSGTLNSNADALSRNPFISLSPITAMDDDNNKALALKSIFANHRPKISLPVQKQSVTSRLKTFDSNTSSTTNSNEYKNADIAGPSNITIEECEDDDEIGSQGSSIDNDSDNSSDSDDQSIHSDTQNNRLSHTTRS